MKIHGSNVTLVARLKGEIDGTKYEIGPIKASEEERILAWTGWARRQWEAELVEGSCLAAQAVIALTRYRAGENVKISTVEIDDVDSIDFDFYDEAGRVVTFKVEQVDGEVRPVTVGGKVVVLLDGEEPTLDPPRLSPTD